MKKVLITSVIVASILITSATVFAEDTNGNNAQNFSTVKVSASVNNNHKSNIEYAKKTLFNPDGSIAAIDESWADPATNNERLDYSEPAKGTSDIVRIQSCFVLDNETRYIKASRTENGSFSGITFSGKNLGNILTAAKQDYINEYKDGTRRAGWSDKGIVKTKDGKDLEQLSRSDTSSIPGDEGKTFIENVYIDKDSGLPVKGYISVKKNGKTSLLYTYVFEFKNVADDGSLFNTEGIKLQETK